LVLNYETHSICIWPNFGPGTKFVPEIHQVQTNKVDKKMKPICNFAYPVKHDQENVAPVNAHGNKILHCRMTLGRRLGMASNLQRVNGVHCAVRIVGIRQRLAVHVKHQGLGLVAAVLGPLAHVDDFVVLSLGDAEGQIAKPLDAAKVMPLGIDAEELGTLESEPLPFVFLVDFDGFHVAVLHDLFVPG